MRKLSKMYIRTVWMFSWEFEEPMDVLGFKGPTRPEADQFLDYSIHAFVEVEGGFQIRKQLRPSTLA